MQQLAVKAILSVFVCVLLLPSSVSAAQFRSGETLQISDRTENLYAAGSDVIISAPVQKDVVVAGENVTIQSEVERGIIAAGKTVLLKSGFVGATVRVAGETVIITGTYNEDVVVAGKTVIIEDAIINGDLVLAAQDFQIQGSSVSGDFFGGYESLEGDLDEQVAGAVQVKQLDTQKAPDKKEIGKWLMIPYEFSLLVALLIAVVFLHSRNRLHAKGILLNRYFFIDLAIGFLLLVVPGIAILLSFFVFLFPLVLPLGAIAYLGLFLVASLIPVYTASLIKNSFRMDVPVLTLVVISYITFLLIRLIPGLQVLGIIPFVLFLTTAGYSFRLIFRMLSFYVKPVSKHTHHSSGKKE